MTTETQVTQQTEPEVKKPTCGIVMPISAIDNCSVEHWEEVKNILIDAISSAGYDANLVSDADDSGVIQKRIVQNLYSNEIVICDVSCKNPNVMFELGMRLAFDKPTIVVMDNMTKYSFDTAPIEHLVYPRDLSYYKIVEFKEKLCGKITGTMRAAKQPDYTTFLKHFGEFKVATIEPKKGSFNDLILSRLDDMSDQIRMMRVVNSHIYRAESNSHKEDINNIIRQAIDSFCIETGIEKSTLLMKDEESQERIDLYKFIIKNGVIRQICGTPSRVRRAINEVLHS